MSEIVHHPDCSTLDPDYGGLGCDCGRKPALNQYQTVNVQCTAAKREIYKIKEFIDKMTHKPAQEQAMELFQRAYDAFDRLQAFIGSRG